MKIPFTKMEGAGNDYIYVDATKVDILDPNKVAKIVSDRHFGIGGDGLVMICDSDIADFRMRMFNADGSEGKMCGNATRCIAKYVYDHGMVKGLETSLDTLSGIKYIDMFLGPDDKVAKARVDMGKPIFEAEKIPTTLEPAFGGVIQKDGVDYTLHCVSMGNPHAIMLVDDVHQADVHGIGPKLENDEHFPERCNIEFVKVINRDLVQMRVWERGSGETLACGTGACATAVALMKLGLVNNRVDVELIGGTLTIQWEEGESVFMTGPATEVFTGEIEIDL